MSQFSWRIACMCYEVENKGKATRPIGHFLLSVILQLFFYDVAEYIYMSIIKFHFLTIDSRCHYFSGCTGVATGHSISQYHPLRVSPCSAVPPVHCFLPHSQSKIPPSSFFSLLSTFCPSLSLSPLYCYSLAKSPLCIPFQHQKPHALWNFGWGAWFFFFIGYGQLCCPAIICFNFLVDVVFSSWVVVIAFGIFAILNFHNFFL